MPLHYKISEQLNLVLYVGTGVIGPSDFYSVESRLLADKRYSPGRITLVDIYDGSISLGWSDINTFLDHLKLVAQYKAGPYVLLTVDQGLHLLARATNLINSRAELRFYVYYNLVDAISTLGWTEHKHEIFQFWRECKTEFSSSTSC